MISYAEAKALHLELDPEFHPRHYQHRKLRDFWHGRYGTEADQQGLLASLVRDSTRPQTDTGPDYKLVRNLVFEVCVKYQSFLSGLPMIRTFVERPDSRTARAQAELKQRVLYGLWSDADMNKQLNRLGWFGPLMGDSFLGVWPNFDQKTVRAVVRSPEHAYPIQSFDGSKLDGLMFVWKTTEAKAKRAFPNWSGKSTNGVEFSASDGSTGVPHGNTVEIVEHSGDNSFQRWVGGEQVNGIDHNLGFNLFDQVPFIHVPGEAWNHGAVEQSVNLVEAGNALYSLMMQAMLENVFPKLILEDPMKFDETLDFGPGSVNAVNPGGKAYYLEPPEAALSAGLQMLQETERSVKQDTSMPDASFGQFDASIITGKAINALQGAGTGSLVEMVQGNGIGEALENWNEKALTIIQRMFPDDKIVLQGMQPASFADLNPRQFSVSFKGKEIIGSPRNEVVFSPYIDQHGKLVMGLQALGAGLVSKSWAREQIGISDSEQMQELITDEVIEEAVIGALVQALQADPSAENADKAESQVAQFYAGKPVVRAGAPPAGPAGPLPPTGPQGPGGQIGVLPGGGTVSAPPQPLPPGAALPQAGAPSQAAPMAAASAAPTAAATITSVKIALAHVQLAGRAWFVGEIAAKGQTAGPVDVAVTDPGDRDVIQQAAPRFQFVFHLVKGEPQEAHVEIAAAPALAAA